jgi:hypothetical protein
LDVSANPSALNVAFQFSGLISFRAAPVCCKLFPDGVWLSGVVDHI